MNSEYSNRRSKLNTALGARLRNARLSLGLTQQEVAEKMGYESSSTVSNHEKGVKMPRYEDMRKYSELFNKPPDWLYQPLTMTEEEIDDIAQRDEFHPSKESNQSRIDLTDLVTSDSVYIKGRLLSDEEKGRLRYALEMAFPELAKVTRRRHV